MTTGIRARVIDDPQQWQFDRVRLVVWDSPGFDQRRYLMPDGTWKPAEPGVDPDPLPGFVVPREAVEAIAVAIGEWQGHTSHADTEARVLREWLAVEKGRVDHALAVEVK